MKDKKVTLAQGIDFHGHLGPYLILGLRMGEWALKQLKAKKYFGCSVKVFGATKKPKSCLIDGLQLSTGATYGKGNIQKFAGKTIRVSFFNKENNTSLCLKLNKILSRQLDLLKTHRESEVFAQRLYKINILELFQKCESSR